jgi:hypothetical protein
MIFDAFFRVWTGLIAALVAAGWVASFFGQLRWMEVAGPLAVLVAVVWLGLQLRVLPREEFTMLRQYFFFWPFWLLLGLISAAALIHPPTVHDSLSYRLPRILLWLQENQVSHISVADERINFMTHVWELVSLPFFRAIGDNLLEWQNIVSWLLFFLCSIGLTEMFVANPVLRRWIAISGAAAYLPLLQACRTSNDLFALVFVMLSVWFFLRARTSHCVGALLWSILALALAAGTKPHYALLVPFWGAAVFLFYPVVKQWKPLLSAAIIAAPVVAVCSPLPTFLLNYNTFGSPMGPIEASGMAEGVVWKRVSASALMFAWANMQLPVNPLAGAVNSITDSLTEAFALRVDVPKFLLVQYEVPLVDAASLGLPTLVLWIFGLICAWKYRRHIPPETWICAAVGFTSFIIAVSFVMPVTLARSFIGFVFLFWPLVLSGLGHGRPLLVKWLVIASVLCGAVAVAATPSNPLWPARSFAKWLDHRAPESKIAAMASKYAAFTTRYNAGKDLVSRVPGSASLVAVVGSEPLLQLWSPYREGRKVVFIASGDELPEAEFVIVGGVSYGQETVAQTSPKKRYDAEAMHGDLVRNLSEGKLPYKLVAQEQYISMLQLGPQEWRLYQKNRE